MTLLDTVNVGETDYGVQSRVPMGTCATPAGSEVKVCAFADNFSLSVGNLIAVTFTYANTYGDGSTTYPKLTINGAQYPIKFPTGEYASDGAWANGQAVTFMFDGTNLLMTTLPVTNEVALNNVHSVSSDAVAKAFGAWETLWSSGNVGGSIIKGIICNGTAFVAIHLQSYVCTSSNLLITTLPAKYRPRVVSRGCCFAVQDPLYMGFLNIESDGRVVISTEMDGKTIYGDCFIMVEKDV